MKYCMKCGNEMLDEAAICMKCGCPVPVQRAVPQEEKPQSSVSAFRLTALVLMVLTMAVLAIYALMVVLITIAAALTNGPVGLVLVSFLFLLPFAWQVPMLVHLARRLKCECAIGVGFKVCTLIFVNPVAGILLLCEGV